MKRNILKAAFVAAFAMIAGYGVYNSQKDVVLSDVALANVEALAFNEYDPNAWYGAKLVMCTDRHGAYIGAKCQEVQDRTSTCKYSSTWGDCD